MMYRSWVILAILMVSTVLAIDQTGWDKHAQATWLSAQDHLEIAHSVNQANHRYQDDLKIPPEDINEAWEYAHRDGSEPIFKAVHASDKKAVYILTKIPSGSALATKWNLDGMGGNRFSKNAFLFWKLKKDYKPKLLGAEVWNVGGLSPNRYRIQDIMLEYFRKVI